MAEIRQIIKSCLTDQQRGFNENNPQDEFISIMDNVSSSLNIKKLDLALNRSRDLQDISSNW